MSWMEITASPFLRLIDEWMKDEELSKIVRPNRPSTYSFLRP